MQLLNWSSVGLVVSGNNIGISEGVRLEQLSLMPVLKPVPVVRSNTQYSTFFMSAR